MLASEQLEIKENGTFEFGIAFEVQDAWTPLELRFTLAKALWREHRS